MHIIALYIILGLILLITLMLSFRVNLHVIYEDELSVYLRVLFFKYYLYPEKTKKFSAKKHDKKKKKESAKKTAIKQVENGEQKSTLLSKLNLVKEILSVFVKSFSKHLHVKVARLHVKVGSPDAAQTAILYGAISGVVACIVELIDSHTRLKPLASNSICVDPDFTAEESEVNINIVLSISSFGAIVTLAKAFWRYTVLKNSKLTERN